MKNILDLDFLLNDTRAKVYLIWTPLLGVGFTATHYYQENKINILWFVISLVGLGFMYKNMPLGVKQMKHILAVWVLAIALGFIGTAAILYLPSFQQYVGQLGAFWLFVMGMGHFWSGLVDPPAKIYFLVAAVNIAFAVLCFSSDYFNVVQYLIAAIVSAWSMLYLWAFRADAY